MGACHAPQCLCRILIGVTGLIRMKLLVPLQSSLLCLILVCSFAIFASLTVVSEDTVSVLSYSCGYSQSLQQSCRLLVFDQTFPSPIGTLGALRGGCTSLLHSRDFPTRQK